MSLQSILFICIFYSYFILFEFILVIFLVFFLLFDILLLKVILTKAFSIHYVFFYHLSLFFLYNDKSNLFFLLIKLYCFTLSCNYFISYKISLVLELYIHVFMSLNILYQFHTSLDFYLKTTILKKNNNN